MADDSNANPATTDKETSNVAENTGQSEKQENVEGSKVDGGNQVEEQGIDGNVPQEIKKEPDYEKSAGEAEPEKSATKEVNENGTGLVKDDDLKVETTGDTNQGGDDGVAHENDEFVVEEDENEDEDMEGNNENDLQNDEGNGELMDADGENSTYEDGEADYGDVMSENQRLRQAILDLGERQAILEEFIEVEYGEKFDQFLKNRERLVNVMGLGKQQENNAEIDGKRSSKSSEIVGLLKVIKTQAATTSGTSSNSSRRESQGNSNRGRGRGHEQNRNNSPRKPGDDKVYKGGIGFAWTAPGSAPSAPTSSSSPPSGSKRRDRRGNKRKLRNICICCYDTDHFIDQCPYRGQRDPETQKEISKRRKMYFCAFENVKNKNVANNPPRRK